MNLILDFTNSKSKSEKKLGILLSVLIHEHCIYSHAYPVLIPLRIIP